MTRSHHVVVGASAAGVSAARAMRQAGYQGRLTLVDADPNLPYERPPLSKALMSGDAALKPIAPLEAYREQDIALRLGVRVTSLDVARRRVVLGDGDELPVDGVVLATGVAARRLSVPGADLPEVLVLRDAADATAVSGRLAAGGPLVVIGGGFIGLELAAVARENGVDVTVVELAPLPLAGAVGTDVGHLVRELHEDRGVRFALGSSVSEIAGTSSVEAVVLRDGRRLPAATVVVGVGVVPRVQLAERAGIRVDEAGIVVDGFGATSLPWVWAAGDVASQPHPSLAAPGRIEHWDVAMRHGAAVGRTAAGLPTPFTDVPYAWSDQFGMTFQVFGRSLPTDDTVIRDGARPDSFLAFRVRDDRITAVIGLQAAAGVAATRRLIESRLPVPRHLLESPEVDLRRVVKELTAAARSTPTP